MAEKCACESNDNSDSRCSTHLVMTSNQWVESRVDAKTGYEEEESSEAEIPKVEMNPKGIQNKNKKIVDVLFTRIAVLLVSKLVVLRDNFKLNRRRKKKEKEQPNGSF